MQLSAAWAARRFDEQAVERANNELRVLLTLTKGEVMPRKYVHKKHFGNGWRRGPLPSQAEFNAAVLAACQVTGADPEHVVNNFQNGKHKSAEHLQIARARVYAAFALRAVFDEGSVFKMAEMFRVSNPKQFYHNKDSDMKEGRLKRWWSDAAFMRVIEAIEAFQAMEKNQKVEVAVYHDCHD